MNERPQGLASFKIWILYVGLQSVVAFLLTPVRNIDISANTSCFRFCENKRLGFDYNPKFLFLVLCIISQRIFFFTAEVKLRASRTLLHARSQTI